MSYKDYLSGYGKKQYNKRTGATAETKNTGGAKTAPAQVVVTPPVTVTVAPLPERSYDQFETEVSKPSPSHTAPENNPFQNEYKEYVEAVTEPEPEPSDETITVAPLPERSYDQFETEVSKPSPSHTAPENNPFQNEYKEYVEAVTEQLPSPTEPKQPEIDLEEIYFAVKYEGLGHDELVSKYNELYEEYAVTGNVDLISELNFLSKRAEETQSPEVLEWKRDKATDNAQRVYKEYDYYDPGANPTYHEIEVASPGKAEA
jgi:hypothetical protein